MGPETEKDLRNSVYDGVFANMFATLTGGAFLTGFALHLGMGELLIGILAAMPFLATIFQLPAASYLLRKGSRKRLCLWAAGAARLAWVPILVVSLLPLPAPLARAVVLVLLTVSYALVSVSFVSWMSWITDRVPEAQLGRFFGTRNMLCGAAGMLVTVVFGHLLDLFERWGSEGTALGFAVTFGVAVALGLRSLGFLKRISEPPSASAPHRMGRSLTLPLRDRNFRRYLLFAFFWGFSVNFASPFFNVYALRDLRFSYGFVATLGVLSALADLMGMRVWGALSDRVKNKPVIRLAGAVATTIPLGWIAVGPDSLVLPILLHVVAGGCWAGINLCSSNLLLRISEPDNRPAYVSLHSLCAGLGSAAGPVLAGLAIKSVTIPEGLHVFGWSPLPLQLVFLGSTVLRNLSLLWLTGVREPDEATVGQLVRVIRSLRGMTTASGFHYLLHPFIEISRDLRSTKAPGPLRK